MFRSVLKVLCKFDILIFFTMNVHVNEWYRTTSLDLCRGTTKSAAVALW